MNALTAAKWAALADALVLGPYLAYSARGERNQYFRAGLLLIGVGTALFGVYRFMNPDEETQPEAARPLGSIALGGLAACGCRPRALSIPRARR